MRKVSDKIYNNLIKYFPRLCVDVLIKNKEDEFLLCKRANMPERGKYYPIGGVIFRGENPKDVAKIKIKEELGNKIKVAKLHFLGYVNNLFKTQHDITLVFITDYKRGKIILDSQHTEYKWSKNIPRKYKQL